MITVGIPPVKPKGKPRAIVNLVTEVLGPVGERRLRMGASAVNLKLQRSEVRLPKKNRNLTGSPLQSDL
jgi:hypothetical protein